VLQQSMNCVKWLLEHANPKKEKRVLLSELTDASAFYYVSLH